MNLLCRGARIVRRPLIMGAFMACGLAHEIDAQCPDGSPPPCARRVRVDTNVFVVLPFTVRGPSSAQYLGESMVDLLHMALDGVGGMRIEYAPTTLRRLNELAQPQDARAAAGVALELAAGRLISGTVLLIGADARIRAEVFDAVRGRTQFTVEGRGDIANVGAIIDSLASAIAARRLVPPSERRRFNMGEYATKSAGALQAYLVARRYALGGDRRQAADSARSALRQDPTFGLAHLLLQRLEGQQGGVTGLNMVEILRAARQHRAQFPDRVRLMLDIGDAYVQGQRLRTLALVNEAALRYPDDPEAAYHLADKYFHYGINLDEPRERVIAMFRRALAFDNQDPELLSHLAVLMAEAGDSAATRMWGDRCHAAAPGVCGRGDQWLFRASFRREDPAIIATGPDSLAFGSLANAIIRYTPWDPAFGLALTDSFARLQTGPNRRQELRRAAYIVRSNVALARGRYDVASAFLDTAAIVGGPADIVYGYRMLHHIVTGSHTPEAGPDRINRNNPNQASLTHALMTRAWWAAVRQPTDSAEPLFRELESRPWPDSAMGVAVARGLRGLVALRLGDTTRARDLLIQARANHNRRNIPVRILLPGAALALTLARLEFARGNAAAARVYLADLYPQNDYVPFIAETEELRANVALASSDTMTARVALRNFIAVWDGADAVLQPRVASARATLARLEDR